MLVAGWGSVVLVLERLAVTVASSQLGVFLAEIQGVDQLAGSEHAKGRFREGVHSAQHPRVVDFAFQEVQPLEQRFAILQSIQRHAVQTHVRGPFTLWFEGLIRGTEKARGSGIRPGSVLGLVG